MESSTKLRKFQQYLEFKKGTSNKFYQIEVIGHHDERGYEVWATYGRIGSSGQRKKYGVGYSFDFAVRVGEEYIEKKISKGYQKVSPLQALASACEEPEERVNKGLSPLEEEIPCWHLSGAVATEKRLDKWASSFLSKLNLIRASFYELDRVQVEHQLTTLFKQKNDDFFRVKKTKAHGAAISADHRTETAAAIFFNELRDRSILGTYFTKVFWGE